MFRAANLVYVLAMAGTAMSMGGCSSVEDPAAEQQEIIENLVEAGYPRADIEIFDNKVYVQLDGHVTLEASREMLGTSGPEEQYRTTNLVGTGVSKICVNPSAAFAAIPKLSQGLDDAIARYNAQSLRITFARGPTTGCTANIAAEAESGTVGGHSGFPSGGLPYDAIFIGTGLVDYSAGVNAHVIMHEIGHTIGFRHSDYYRRKISCGRGGNEGAGTIGAILIPGTPPTATLGGSVMNACFRSSETGQWTSTDVIALDYLY